MADLFDTGVQKAAVLSDCGLYRYSLSRIWDASLPSVCWICLNPSTADAEIDDPTIRRVVGFSRAWGYGGIVVVNIYAFRATDPSDLAYCHDPAGPDNLRHVLNAIENAGVTVCAWGAYSLSSHGVEAVTRIRESGRPLFCLGVTAGGHPKHPLYIRGDTKLIPFGA